MTNHRIFNGGGASVTALCAICTGGAYDRRQPRPHALPLRGRRHPADHQQHASRPALAGDAMAANHRPLYPRFGCAAPGRQYRRQLDAHTNIARTSNAYPPVHKKRLGIATLDRYSGYTGWFCTWGYLGEHCQEHRPLDRYCRRKSAHGYHQPILQRIHLAPHGLTAGRGWAAC